MKLAVFILISLSLCCYGCATTSNCVDLSGKWGYQYDGDAGPGGEFDLVQEGCTFSTSSHMYHISGTVIGNEVPSGKLITTLKTALLSRGIIFTFNQSTVFHLWVPLNTQMSPKGKRGIILKLFSP